VADADADAAADAVHSNTPRRFTNGRGIKRKKKNTRGYERRDQEIADGREEAIRGRREDRMERRERKGEGRERLEGDEKGDRIVELRHISRSADIRDI
jgi:hypothetical protein